MKIILYGVETKNKGAELMLYAILQEIERRFPYSKVYIPVTRFKQELRNIHTSLNICFWPFGNLVQKMRLRPIFEHLHLPTRFLQDVYAVRNADYFIDSSGFHFSDQKKSFTRDRVWMWKHLLNRLSRQGCRIVFLPQAFGPAQKKATINGFKVISEYASLIMPRDQISYNYLEQSGVVNMIKVKLFTDFTSLVEGVFPKGYEHLKNGICIIPNLRMVDTGTISKESYLELISAMATSCESSGHPVYLLNHEGKGDEQLAYECKNRIGNHIEVVSGLNALEVKGMIASAYLVVSSRFHGVASALNSCVPCLATSWSHKYSELFRDYALNDCVLPLDDTNKVIKKVLLFLDEDNNQNIRRNLYPQVEAIKKQTREMWEMVWTI